MAPSPKALRYLSDDRPSNAGENLRTNGEKNLGNYCVCCLRKVGYFPITAESGLNQNSPNVQILADEVGFSVVGTRVIRCVDEVVDQQSGPIEKRGDFDQMTRAVFKYRDGYGQRIRNGIILEPILFMTSSFLKRLIDIAIATSCLFLLSPVVMLVGFMVGMQMGPPVFFRQIRPGINGRPFIFLKFRTMTSGRDADGCMLPDKCRITSLGNFLRKTSLDELPQLWNVIRGDMSLVGPRPLLMEYLPRYTKHQMRRHEVKPGITGWAQVNGRNELSWEDKFDLDVYYVDNWSLKLDLKIIFMTVKAVLKRSGINQPGHATMTEFKGYDC